MRTVAYWSMVIIPGIRYSVFPQTGIHVPFASSRRSPGRREKSWHGRLAARSMTVLLIVHISLRGQLGVILTVTGLRL